MKVQVWRGLTWLLKVKGSGGGSDRQGACSDSEVTGGLVVTWVGAGQTRL